MPLAYRTTMALEDLDVAYLKANYLTDFTFFGPDGQSLPPSFFEEALQNALAVLEQTTQIDVLSRVYLSEKHDYRVNDYLQFAFLQLFKIPCLSVQQVRAVYPTGQTIQVFPSQWVKLETSHSQIQLVPTAGTLSEVIIGQGGAFLPLIYGGLDSLPQLWEVDYTSGFPPDAVPRMIIQALAKMASIEILLNMSDLVRPLGITSQSLSVDGLSQSRGYLSPPFRARIDAYRADLWGIPGSSEKGLIGQIRDTFLGIAMVAL